jgi:hypothetical protein
MNKRLSQLRDAMAVLLPFREQALPFLYDAHIDISLIDFGGGPYAMWSNIITYTAHNRQVEDLVEAVLRKFPKNPHLLAFREDKTQYYDNGPDIRNDVNWNDADESIYEKIMEAESTLLPIRFLAVGLEKAKSVARIVIDRDNMRELGTGFLIDGNLLVTNHHVLKNEADALAAKIQFNYEESVNGNPIAPVEFLLDPAQGFITSAADDYTVVRILGDANKDFGRLTLSNAQVRKGDYVSIIQHPAGRYKEIGLFHNIITFCNADVVQYLTDTEPGSSGSPVFDPGWEVVALHHSGGMLREPGTALKLLRNEGIHIGKVADGIKAAGLL